MQQSIHGVLLAVPLARINSITANSCARRESGGEIVVEVQVGDVESALHGFSGKSSHTRAARQRTFGPR